MILCRVGFAIAALGLVLGEQSTIARVNKSERPLARKRRATLARARAKFEVATLVPQHCFRHMLGRVRATRLRSK